MEEARRLLQVGYDRAGNWSLGQVCNHLAMGIEMSIKGFLSRIPEVLQRAMVATYFRLFFLGKIGKRFNLRMPTEAPQKQPVDDEVGLQRLVAAIGLLKDADAAHWNRMHLWHCEHHLGFLIPHDKDAASE